MVAPDGRYDASNGGDIAGLHGVINNRPIALCKIKDRCYEPGLLARCLGVAGAAQRPAPGTKEKL